LIRAGILVAMALVLCAGGAALAAPAPNVPAKLRAAIALEKKALEDLDKGDLDSVEKDLKQSRSLLQGSLPGVRGDDYTSARSDIKQASAKDDVALSLLRKPRERGFVRLKINEAIIRKQGALAAFGYETKVATAQPPPPKTSQPPRVTSFSADLKPPDTEYRIVATDPDTLNLTYTWTNSNPCGTFTPNGSRAVWGHGNETNCDHTTPFHPGTITVTVADGVSSCTVTDPNGSLSVPEFDPGEDCKNLPPAPLLGLGVAEAEKVLDRVEDAIRAEDQGNLKSAAAKLKAIVIDLSNALSAKKGTFQEEDIEDVMEDLHEAEELDREAMADAAAKATGDAKAKQRKARDRKERAARILQDIIDD
jgi:hypothetical protein